MPGTAITIGNFDGVHRGHQALVARARERVGADGRVVALVFDPHPMSVLRPGHAPERVSTFGQRETWLIAAGADQVDRLVPTPDLLGLTPEAFVRAKVDRYQPAYIVEGDDFHFGKARAGSAATLRELGPKYGFACEVVPPVDVTLSDHSLVRASSTILRWLIAHGRVDDAARVLGRAWEVDGVVGPGDRRGRAIGVPTANVQTTQLLPGDGVYAATVEVPDGSVHAAAANVGSRPTFDGVGRRLEVHVLDVTSPGMWTPLPGLPEYGWAIKVRMLGWVRDDLRFPSLRALCEQMDRDLDRCREIAASA